MARNKWCQATELTYNKEKIGNCLKLRKRTGIKNT